MTTLNVIKKEENFHYCNISMMTVVTEEDIKLIKNQDQKSCAVWEWIDWNEFVERKDLFHSFHYMFAAGFKERDKIFKAAGVLVEKD